MLVDIETDTFADGYLRGFGILNADGGKQLKLTTF